MLGFGLLLLRDTWRSQWAAHGQWGQWKTHLSSSPSFFLSWVMDVGQTQGVPTGQRWGLLPPVNPDAFNQGARAVVMGSGLFPSLYPQDSGPTRTAKFARDTCAFPFWTPTSCNPLPRSSKALIWVPSKFFLPLAHLNQNSLSLSPQLIRSDYLIKLIRTEVWMRPNPPGGICILKEERVNPNASTISGMCGETFWGAGSFPVPPASQAIPSLGEPMYFPHQRN